MKDLIGRAKEFKYTSLGYLDPDDLLDSEILIDDEKMIFIYSKTKEKIKIDWAVNSKTDFFCGLDDVINLVCNTEYTGKVYIEFIPEDFVFDMECYEFNIASEWIDFWMEDLTRIDVVQPETVFIRNIKDTEYQIALEVTKSCKGYSRGYEGQTYGWIQEWHEEQNSRIFVAEMNHEIIGVCFVNLYGFESEKGTVLWIRELAVMPEYHSQKIGLNLISYAINWGKSAGAKRSFLACDAENTKAIRLYEGLRYRRKMERGQINMQRIFSSTGGEL